MIYKPFKMLPVVVLLTATIASAADPKQANDYDVVVIGGTPAGVAAAIAAARADKTVIIIEQAPCLGGVLSSGVLRLDDKYVESNSGVMEEFRQRVKAYHRNEMADDPLVQAHMNQDPRRVWNIAEGRAWEPHTAARIYAEMVAEHTKITTRLGEVAFDAKMKDDRVTGVLTGGGAKVKLGQHLVLPKDTPLCNVWLTMLQGMGINVERHGDSTGVVKELQA